MTTMELCENCNYWKVEGTPCQCFAKAEEGVDPDVGGDHYTKLNIEPLVYSYENELDPYQHTIIKYVTRHKDKGGAKDIDKAINVLKLYKEKVYG